MKYKDLQNTARVRDENVNIAPISVFEFGPLFWEAVAQALRDTGFEDSELIITSGCDGTHSKLSQHYRGKAVDMRIRSLKHRLSDCEVYSTVWWALLRAAIRALGEKLPGYAFVIERDHLHIQSNFENLKTKTGNVSTNVWSSL